MLHTITRVLAVLLVCGGLLGFVLGGVSFTTEDTVMDVGPVEVEEQDETTIPLGPIASGTALLLGAGLFVVDSRTR
jgi:hypothetical protein